VIEVRAARSEDWQRLRDLRLRALADSPDAFRATLDATSSRIDPDWAEQARTTAERADAESWIAERDGVPVGQAHSYLRDDGAGMGISAMWVAPEGRGAGVGGALLAAAEEWGRAHGCSTVYLFVAEGNGPARRLYEGSGYHPTGEDRPLRDGSALTCAEMAKPL
jgi:GNAT superfamily N-acetyltransferase